jgi:hypothetical protein
LGQYQGSATNQILSPLPTTINIFMHINYINYPSIPEELLLSVDEIISLPAEANLVKEFQTFWNKKINPELEEWLRSSFKMKFYAYYQVIHHKIPIHYDKPAFKGDRRIAFNYLLDLGGDNVITSIYDKDYKTLESKCLPLKKWHSIKVEMLHGVEGIDPNKFRVALSVTPLF